MKRVFKYEVPLVDHFTLAMPRYAQILAFQTRRERPHIWALVDPEETAMTDHEFMLVGTGHLFPIEDQKDLLYRGTCQMHDGSLVWHLFEVVRF